MKLRAIIEYEVDPKDYVNRSSGILEVPVEKQDEESMLELLSEIWHNVTDIKIEEIT